MYDTAVICFYDPPSSRTPADYAPINYDKKCSAEYSIAIHDIDPEVLSENNGTAAILTTASLSLAAKALSAGWTIWAPSTSVGTVAQTSASSPRRRCLEDSNRIIRIANNI